MRSAIIGKRDGYLSVAAEKFGGDHEMVMKELSPEDSTVIAARRNKYWVLLDTGTDFQPLSFFGYYFFGQADDELTIPGYLHWLQIWDEGSGCVTIDVYYPAYPKLGEVVKVLAYINSVAHDIINWQHGDEGLFLLHIQNIMDYADG